MTFPAFASLLPIATHDEYLLLPGAVFTVIALIPWNLDLLGSILVSLSSVWSNTVLSFSSILSFIPR